ncbi:MAG: ribosome maturation factor RimP [Erysipelotrichaceae bacterium]|nr:ribosome maturation factor RimP [Erysipelotrichaceae bacterium]
MKEEEKKIFDDLLPLVAELGYELKEVRLSGTKSKTLSVVVDRVDPISLEDIVLVSEKVSAYLDEADPIKDAYTLDVSSLGAEKPIELPRLSEYVGRYVNLHLSHPFKGENVLEGTLLSCDEENLTLRIKDKSLRKDIDLPRKDVDRARLAIDL